MPPVRAGVSKFGLEVVAGKKTALRDATPHVAGDVHTNFLVVADGIGQAGDRDVVNLAHICTD